MMSYRQALIMAMVAIQASAFFFYAYPSSQAAKPQSVTLPKTVSPAAVYSTKKPLTLDDLLTQVRQNHPKLFSADLERRIAGAKLLEKQGAFDPAISLDSDYLRYNDFSNPGKVSKVFDNELSVSWLTRSGLKLSTGARYNQGDIKPPIYPTGDSGEYFVGAKMPLLRGFRINDKVAAEMQATLGIPSADASFTETRLSVLLQAANAYWNWVIADRKITVSDQMLNLATVRNTAIKQRTDSGDLPRIDAAEASQEVQRRQGFLAKVNREYEKAVFKLSRYLWEPHGTPSPQPDKSAIPDTFPAPVFFTDDDWMEGRKTALEQRPELKTLNLQKQITEIDLKLAKNQRLPVLDLFATPGIDTGDKSIGPTLKAGIVLIVPLRQRTAKGLIKAAEFKLQKIDMEQRLLLQNVLLEVDDAVSAINAAHKQYTASLREYKLARQLEQGERDRFDYGDSNLFMVNQRERATLDVALKQLDIEAEYHQAVAYFRAVTGQL